MVKRKDFDMVRGFIVCINKNSMGGLEVFVHIVCKKSEKSTTKKKKSFDVRTKATSSENVVEKIE
jgi:hypothetical protein